VREALFSSLADIGGPGVAGLVAPLLRNDDAALRGGAVETLKRLDAAAAAVLDALLDDADPDIRLLAIEVTRSWPSARAAPRLLRILAHDAHVNVCAAAVDVATEVGDGALLAALAALPDRFPDQPFLRFAVTVARARISAADARDTPARDAG
jgi:HEAT repeat protein